jgi:alkaline phosphatase
MIHEKRIRSLVYALYVGLVACAILAAGLTESEARTGYAYSGTPAKYVFLFIGDGMGMPQRTAAAMYLASETDRGLDTVLNVDKFPAQGVTTTYANDRFITGSAASATALACGQKTNINYIGVDPEYRPVKTIAEMARDKGQKVGIISSVSIDHATPASFYAHVKTRKMYHEIDHALADSGFDFFGGGGFKDPEGKKSKNPMGDALAKARKNGYTIVDTRSGIMGLKPSDGKVIAVNSWLQDSGAMPYEMDRKPSGVSLPEITSKAIEMLDNDDKGFFLMVEGGKIDWACHANDAVASIMDTLAFDAAVAKAMDFMNRHPDETLIVVTGDHECGGLTLGYAGTRYASHWDVLAKQDISFQKFTDEVLPSLKKDKASFSRVKSVITRHFGLKFSGPESDPLVLAAHEVNDLEQAWARSLAGEEEMAKDPVTAILYGGYEPLAVAVTHTLNHKAGLSWTSYKHTGVPVTTSAAGLGASLFNGYYDNTDVAKKMMAIMGFSPKVQMAAN